MAKTDRWNARLQVAANLGLIAGLVLVAVQIQQTRDRTRLQLDLEGTLAFQQVELCLGLGVVRGGVPVADLQPATFAPQ